MTDDQKKICRALLTMSFEFGFNLFALQEVADKTGFKASDLYDGNTESGILWPFHPAARGNLAGLLTFHGYGENASVGVDMSTREMLSHWSNFRG